MKSVIVVAGDVIEKSQLFCGILLIQVGADRAPESMSNDNDVSITVSASTVVKAEKEYAEYKISVREGSCKYEIKRRWSDLKAMMEELERTEKRDMDSSRSTLPKFEPHSFRLWGHTHPDYLAERMVAMQALLNSLVSTFTVSVIERSGPKTILTFFEPPAGVNLEATAPEKPGLNTEMPSRMALALKRKEEAKAKAAAAASQPA